MVKVKPRFPRQRSDGSFDIRIILDGLTLDRDQLESWLTAWSGRNEIWRSQWKRGSDQGVEVFKYMDEFVDRPSAEFSKGEKPRVLLRVRPGSKRWKNWMTLKLIAELSADFPEVRVYQIVDHTGEGPPPVK